MTTLRRRRRGEPLIVLGMIMLCWIGLRAAAWRSIDGVEGAIPVAIDLPPSVSRSREAPPPASPGAYSEHLAAAPTVLAVEAVRSGIAERFADDPVAVPPIPGMAAPLPPPAPVSPGLAGGHAMMWLAAVGRMPAPTALLAAAVQPVPPAVLPHSGSPERRWSADAWALLRGGGGFGGAGPSVPTYGGSQVGAVLRYRLAPGNPHRPTAYLRISAALNGVGEREAALGLSARPIAALPVVLAAEGRLGRLSGRTVVRPAALAVTELAPIPLPANARAEVYAQGGYVGGQGATPFVDGQVRVDRPVARFGLAQLRAGAGVWAGAQQGAARLDIGPSATLGVTQGGAAARVGLDWRFRITGTAAPSSGPALTISAGF